MADRREGVRETLSAVERTTLRVGPRPSEASAAVLLLHGRGGSPEDMLHLARALDVGASTQVAGRELAFVAPRAAGGSWYPYSFLAPIDDNEPWLSNSLAAVGAELDAWLDAGLPADRVAIVGFSQGGCLGLEYGARHARRYGALIGLSSGLVGPPGAPRDYPGDLDGTPVFLGCSDVDPHIPRWRVDESATVLADLGAEVDARIYPGMGHTVNDDELRRASELIRAMLSPGR